MLATETATTRWHRHTNNLHLLHFKLIMIGQWASAGWLDQYMCLSHRDANVHGYLLHKTHFNSSGKIITSNFCIISAMIQICMVRATLVGRNSIYDAYKLLTYIKMNNASLLPACTCAIIWSQNLRSSIWEVQLMYRGPTIRATH